MTAAHTDPFAWWQQWMKQAPSLPLPGFAVPTLDLDELDRRIREYRTVEGWLQMNLSSVQMMRQSLEMQRAAVAAWQEMNQNWQQAPAPEATAPPPPPPPPPPKQQRHKRLTRAIRKPRRFLTPSS
ncbi:PhaM family polyhydroxyalkanoate granule multifunctional regulatory protein [Hydrogenophilus thermoluteolus]|uniref:PhaM family polyhydroxyalkanoate granule multifunctional regulatory protein n=1 Tax=Hydrogenophilus thermoluteolus TaxID=297 RepID=UPI003F662B67